MSGTGYGTPAPPGASHGYGPPVGPGVPNRMAPLVPPGQLPPDQPPPGQVPPGPLPPPGQVLPGQPPSPGRRQADDAALTARRGSTGGSITAPPTQVVVGSLIGAVVGGSLLGLVIGILAPPEPPTPKVINAVSATGSPTASPTGRASGAASPSASPSISAKIKTITRSEAAPPNAHIDRPWADGSMKLMILEDVWQDGDGLVVRGRPARLLSGAKAKAYYEQKGEEPRDYAAESTGEAYELKVRGDATLFGEKLIGYSDEREIRQFGKDEFRDRARNAIDGGHHPKVWLKRTLGTEGPVIYVGEQYMG